MLTQLSLDFTRVAPSIFTDLSLIPTALSVTPAEHHACAIQITR